VIGYLGLIEFVKARFYARQGRPQAAPSSAHARHKRFVQRRAARFMHSGAHRPAGAGGR
jgi:hypothetical protein